MAITIISLPNEVIVTILGYNDISIEDIINFRCVCKRFMFAANYDKFLEKKFSQRWPSAKKTYDKQSKEIAQKDSQENEKKDEKSLNFMETGINCVRELRSLISQMIHKNDCDKSINTYDNKTIDNFILFEDIFHLDTYLNMNLHNIIEKPENIIKYYIFTDEMKNLFKQSPRRTGCDLTKRYYNKKLFHYMRERSMENKMNRFVKRSDREQLLERAATIVAQSVQSEKDIFYSDIKGSLDNIALEVLNCVREKYPNHSIFSTFAENVSFWQNNNIDDNHWNEEEGLKIMNILDKYIFDKLNFRPSNSRDANLKYMCIDYVLENKCGHQIILLIIYHSVARRLGLRCDVIGLQYRSFTIPITYCIFWKPKHAVDSLEKARCFNINNSKIFPNCFDNQLQFWRLHYNDSNIIEITAARIWKEMKEIIVNLINQNNLFDIKILPESRLFGLVSRKIRLCFNKTEQLTRSEDVKFAIGMIVTHNQSIDSCAGVIIGWHRPVDIHIMFIMSSPYVLHSSYICTQCVVPLNHCNNFDFRKQQTNYVILTENNKICYVGEDALTLTPKWIDNSEIGRYFYKFENTHYVPNKTLARLYPQDAAIAAQTTIRN